MPLGEHGQILNETIDFINKVLQVEVSAQDLKACHAHRPYAVQTPPNINAKFVQFTSIKSIGCGPSKNSQ